MSAAAIARALGGSGRAHNGWCSCTCPVCRGENKLGLKDAGSGFAVNCFKLCRRADILSELDRLGLLADRPIEPEDPAITAQRRAREDAELKRRIAEGRDFIGECVPWNATGQIARYLRSRGIDPVGLGPSIMFHGMSRHPEGGQRPLMVGIIEHVELGVIGASKTYIAIDGSQKATFHKPRLFIGATAGGAVRLGAVDPDIELVVGEGVESVLSYMRLHSLPGWAALSAGGVKRLKLPPEARRIVIACDNDESGIGQRAGRAAAWRFGREGRRVRVEIPPAPGDFNDVLMRRALHAA